MTLGQIIKLALAQLDEDAEDAEEFRELFTLYANQGNRIAVEDYYRPRILVPVKSDERGVIERSAFDEGRILEIREASGRPVSYVVEADGSLIRVARGNETYEAWVETPAKQLVAVTDEPEFPEAAHGALVDYICYRHLLSGNAAKQQRAQVYYQQFAQQLRRIVSQNAGSVTHMRGLYSASDIRRGW